MPTPMCNSATRRGSDRIAWNRPAPSARSVSAAAANDSWETIMATRGFTGQGRYAGSAGRLPPGQFVTEQFPVLSVLAPE